MNKPQPGDTLGDLTVVRRQYLRGGRLLLCRCRCGRGVRLWTRSVAASATDAKVSCASCAAGQLWLDYENLRAAG